MDVIIIGGGVIGCLLAKKLSTFQLNLTLIEASDDVANKTTMANSAIIHTGYDPEEGTLKAKLNVLGSKQYEKLAHQLSAYYEQVGSLVVGNDLSQIEELYQRSISRDIICEKLDQNQLLEKEPNLNKDINYGLYFPQTAIVNPMEIAINSMEVALINETKLVLNEEVINIEKDDLGFVVTTTKNTYHCDIVINCSGVNSSKVYELINPHQNEYSITCKKGEYYVMDKNYENLINHIIFPLPDENGKGVLLVKSYGKNILVGPTSLVMDNDDESNTEMGLNDVKTKAKKLISHIDYRQVIRSFAGVRATTNRHDFIIEESKINNFYNIGGIDSPGLASAPAIVDYFINDILKASLVKKEVYEDSCPHFICVDKLSLEKKQEAFKHNCNYGKIVCRCENVSYQEIMDSLHRLCHANSVVGVKKRVRCGMGRCQGGFCENQIVKMISQELNIPLKEVNYKGEDTPILKESIGD
ncbi:MAG: FAD-dependent oxidoreductase [Erysipelotrichaceae bacterium]